MYTTDKRVVPVTAALVGALLKLVGLALVLAVPAVARASEMVNFEVEIMTTQGFVHPAVKVGFNPQPEPPGRTVPDMTDPTQPRIGWLNSDNHYQIVFGFDLGGRVVFDTPQPLPDALGHYEFSMTVPGQSPDTFDVFFEVSATQGSFNRASWVGFNPQPEPPGFADKMIGFEFDVSPASPTSAEWAFRIVNRQTGGDAFFVYPEPVTVALMGLGLAGVFAARRKGQK